MSLCGGNFPNYKGGRCPADPVLVQPGHRAHLGSDVQPQCQVNNPPLVNMSQPQSGLPPPV